MQRQKFAVGAYQSTNADPIGRGSFAEVFAGQHVESGEAVAIKVIDLQRLKRKDKKLVQHLAVEIKVMQDLRHRNIVRMHNVHVEEPFLYMMLELCEFGDLSQHVRQQRGGVLSEARTRFFMMQLRDGLAFLRDRRIVHRDLKPQNLLLSAPIR